MNKKEKVCYQVSLQQLKVYMEFSSSMHFCWLRKTYLTFVVSFKYHCDSLMVCLNTTELFNCIYYYELVCFSL
jgi:hypothetical protein